MQGLQSFVMAGWMGVREYRVSWKEKKRRRREERQVTSNAGDSPSSALRVDGQGTRSRNAISGAPRSFRHNNKQTNRGTAHRHTSMTSTHANYAAGI